MQGTKAFTVIELLITIGVIGIIAGIGLPVYKTLLPTLDLNAATRDLASDLRHAQQLAVTEQVVHSITFNQAHGEYVMSKGYPTSTPLSTKRLSGVITIQSVSGFSSATASFIPTGAAIETGSLILANSKGRTSTIEIKPSGYVKIQ